MPIQGLSFFNDPDDLNKKAPVGVTNPGVLGSADMRVVLVITHETRQNGDLNRIFTKIWDGF